MTLPTYAILAAWLATIGVSWYALGAPSAVCCTLFGVIGFLAGKRG